MVDVSSKEESERMARARGTVSMKDSTLERIAAGGMAKGDVLAVAQVAGIMAAKRTPELIPMCHPLLLSMVDIGFEIDRETSCLMIESTVKNSGRTGVEMEALTAVAVAALTVYDMCKSVDRWMRIEKIELVEKQGGKSGRQERRETDER
jgi:cyclic pyranopterin phosphate synthase